MSEAGANPGVRTMNRMYLAVAIAAIAFPAYAQSPSSKTQGTAPSAATKEFVNKAAIGDMYEIQSSELAQSKAQNKEFQTFADQIIEDHTKSSNELKQLVQDIEGGYTLTDRSGPQAFKVMPLLVYRIWADGRPDEIVDRAVLREVFDLDVPVHQVGGAPSVS